MAMDGSILKNYKLQIVFRFLTALAFALFTFYQFILLFALDVSKFGRLLGIICFLMITVSSFLTFSQKKKNKKVLTFSSVLFVAGLFLFFFIKLINVPALFGMLDFAYPYTVLNCLAFIFAEAGIVTLAVFYLTTRKDRDTAEKRKSTKIMMSIVIALYVACLITECVMLIVYRVNNELSLKVTLISKLVYCFGFVGTAIGFMLPAPTVEEEVKSGEFVYSEDVDDEIDLVM